MINLSFDYSKEFEEIRVKTAIGRLNWYLANKYSLNSISFPKSIDKDKLFELSENDLIIAINQEYDKEKYSSCTDSIRQMYEKYEPVLEKFITKIGLTHIPEIKIYLTKYGIGGSYHLPNEIIINIDQFFSIGLIRNVLHEIIHLHIEKLIQKYRVTHWEKEIIVNLLFEQAFPDIYKKPNIPVETKGIDNAFKNNFPDIKKIFELLY